jgi:hypothetical protein
MNKLSQVGAQAIIILALAASLRLVPAPGVQALHTVLAVGYYALFTLSTVASLHGCNGAAGLLFGAAVLLAFPDLSRIAEYATPIGIGVLLGNAGRQLLRTTPKEDRRERPE